MTNSRFEDLERRCQKIRRQRIAKTVSMCVLISLAGFCYFYYIWYEAPLNVELQKPSKDTIVEDTNVSMPFDTNTKTEELNQTSKISSESNNLSIISEAINKPVENEYDTLILSPKVKAIQTKKLPIEEKIHLDPPTKTEALPMEDFLAKPEPKKTLSMSITSLSSEEALLKNFHSSNAFSEAIALAHFYFERKEYVKAIAWCKESSKLKPVSDEPWLLYAKAKFHLGERTEAIRSLELFLSYVNSKDVRELLTFYKGQQ